MLTPPFDIDPRHLARRSVGEPVHLTAAIGLTSQGLEYATFFPLEEIHYLVVRALRSQRSSSSVDGLALPRG